MDSRGRSSTVEVVGYRLELVGSSHGQPEDCCACLIDEAKLDTVESLPRSTIEWVCRQKHVARDGAPGILAGWD